MPDNNQINKLIKRVYPAAIYSRVERRALRSSLLSDIMDYIAKHDNVTYQELENQFLNKHVIKYNKELRARKLLKYILIVSALLLLICMILYIYANRLQPYTYYV